MATRIVTMRSPRGFWRFFCGTRTMGRVWAALGAASGTTGLAVTGLDTAVLSDAARRRGRRRHRQGARWALRLLSRRTLPPRPAPCCRRPPRGAPRSRRSRQTPRPRRPRSRRRSRCRSRPVAEQTRTSSLAAASRSALSSRTWAISCSSSSLVSPSLQRSKRLPGSSSSSQQSGSTSGSTPSALVKMCLWGWTAASSEVSSPLRTISSTTLWSSVSLWSVCAVRSRR